MVEIKVHPLPKLAGPWNERAFFRGVAKHAKGAKATYIDHQVLEAVCQACAYGEHTKCFHHGHGRQYMRAEDIRREYPACLCEAQGHPVGDTCTVRMTSDWSSHRCDRQVAGVIPSKVYVSEPVDVPVCKMHLNGHLKRQENQRKWREEWDAKDAANQHRREAERAAREVVPRIVEALNKLDVAAAAQLVGTDGHGHITLTVDAALAFAQAIEMLETM